MDWERSQQETPGVAWAGPTSLILGALATGLQALSCMPVAGVVGPGLVFVVSVGVFCGWLALRNARDDPSGRWLGAVGLVLSLVNMAIGLFLLLLLLAVIVVLVAASLS